MSVQVLRVVALMALKVMAMMVMVISRLAKDEILVRTFNIVMFRRVVLHMKDFNL